MSASHTEYRERKQAQEKAARLIKSLIFIGGRCWEALVICGGLYKNLHGKDRISGNQTGTRSLYVFKGTWNTSRKKKPVDYKYTAISCSAGRC